MGIHGTACRIISTLCWPPCNKLQTGGRQSPQPPGGVLSGPVDLAHVSGVTLVFKGEREQLTSAISCFSNSDSQEEWQAYFLLSGLRLRNLGRMRYSATGILVTVVRLPAMETATNPPKRT